MANIAVTQTQVDGSSNSLLHPELAAKRDDVTGLIQGNFQISNNVHGEGTKFISGASEFNQAEPDMLYIATESGNGSATMAAADIAAGDMIFACCLYYQGTPGLPSGFTNIRSGRYSTYHGWRYAYKIATSTDASNGITVSNGNYVNLIMNFRPKSGTSPTYTGGAFVSYNNQYSSYYTPVTTSSSVLIFVSMTVNSANTIQTPDPADGFLNDLGVVGLSTGANVVTYAHRIVYAGQSVSQVRANIGGSNFRDGGILQFNI